MIVLVSMRMVENSTYPEKRDAISHDWSRLFSRLGIAPILVPNTLDDIDAYYDLGPSALLLTGGDNLGSSAKPSLRDITERRLLAGALTHKLPVFGACRGLQFINHYFGGDVERKLPEKHVGEHPVRLTDGNIIRINSFHDEGVLTKGLAPNLDIFAITDGGVVEAVRHKTLPITAIQWHPERPNPAAELDQKLLGQWLAQCA